MFINFNWKTIIAFLLLVFFIHELHELAHVITARMVCGCWGTRDFSYWSLCPGCDHYPNMATAIMAGPILTYIFIWTGWRFLMDNRDQFRSLGLALIFAGLPFARIIAALTGGGDEVNGLRILFEQADKSNEHLVELIGLVAVLAILLPPLIAAFRRLNSRTRVWTFPLLLIVPVIIDRLIVSTAMDNLLKSGVLSMPSLANMPLLLLLWLPVLLLLLLLSWRYLFTFADSKRKI